MRLLPATVVAFLLLSCPAWAMTSEEAEQQLFNQHFKPAAVFPRVVPSALSGADLSVSVDAGSSPSRGWGVGWTAPGADGGWTDYLWFGRRPKGRELQKLLNTAKARKTPGRKVRIGKLQVWKVCTHNCGYAWVSGKFFYSISGVYTSFGKDGSKRMYRDQQAIIKSLRPVRDLGIAVPDESAPGDNPDDYVDDPSGDTGDDSEY